MGGVDHRQGFGRARMVVGIGGGGRVGVRVRVEGRRVEGRRVGVKGVSG